MKKIAVHSQKGGVGKTTLCLLLAKYAVTRGLRPCVLDLDFIGSGMANLLRIEKSPLKYIEDFFLHGNPHEYDVKNLLGLYTDAQVRSTGVEVVLNIGKGLLRGRKAKALIQQEIDMMGLVANEPYYQEIHTKTEVLFGLLEKLGFTMAIVDCHPGLGLVSGTVRPLVDLNVYVTTQNRGDCFGLLKEVNLRKLDSSRSLLVLNRAEPPAVDLSSLRRLFKTDKVLGPDARAVMSSLKHMAVSEKHTVLVNESEDLRIALYLGRSGLLPQIDTANHAFDFCRKARALATGKR